MQSKSNWILKHILPKKQQGSLAPCNSDLNNHTREHYLKYKEEARELCEEKCKYWAEKMRCTLGVWVEYNRIAIKSMKTKWGSCSSKKNLNFNYKILFLNEKDKDYLIVHELSHLVHMNHSSKFWDLVCEILGSEEFRKYKMLID